jgi:hypothetical protein
VSLVNVSDQGPRRIRPGSRPGLLWLACAGLAFGPVQVRAQPELFEFADGAVQCEVVPAGNTIPDLVRTTLPIAMRMALAELGPPPGPARLIVRLQKPPPFYKRALLRVEAHAVQAGDEILLTPGADPLKLAFRLGHEFSHWLVYKQHPARPPLWLDEGLANAIAAAAAEACARTLKLKIERPEPPKLDRHLFTLEQLVARQDYPRQPDEVGAFYWQAEALVAALRRKLAPADFKTYLSLLAVPDPPAWDAPLRERWYFNDGDMAWFARQIDPDTRQRSAR